MKDGMIKQSTQKIPRDRAIERKLKAHRLPTETDREAFEREEPEETVTT